MSKLLSAFASPKANATGRKYAASFIKDAAICREKSAAYRCFWLGSCTRATRARFFSNGDAKLFFVVNSMPHLESLNISLHCPVVRYAMLIKS